MCLQLWGFAYFFSMLLEILGFDFARNSITRDDKMKNTFKTAILWKTYFILCVINIFFSVNHNKSALIFYEKNGCPPLKNTTAGSDFLRKYFLFNFFNHHKRASIFYEKNGCPLWKNTTAGSDFLRKYFLFYFFNHNKRASIFYQKMEGME